jgi:hypothetical protein
LGDFDPKRHSPGYVSEFRFVPNQTEDFELCVTDLHKGLRYIITIDIVLDFLNWFSKKNHFDPLKTFCKYFFSEGLCLRWQNIATLTK